MTSISIRYLQRLLLLCALIAFAACQIACRSHFHCHELSHLDHHHHAPSGYDDDHGNEYEHSECGSEECAFTDVLEHSGFDHTIAPNKPELWWPEIEVVCVEAPIPMAASRDFELNTAPGQRSLIDRLGYTFIGRSPTTS